MLRKNFSSVIKIGGILSYTSVNFIDKGLNFIVPLLILKLCGQSIYNDIEYIISCSLLGASFLDFGIKVYCFYDYRSSGAQAVSVLRDNLNFLFFIQWLFYVLFLIYKPNLLSLAICFRISYCTYQYWYSSYSRLLDRPLLSFKYSLSLNLCLLVTLFILRLFSASFTVGVYILFNGLFTIFVLYNAINQINFRKQFQLTILYISSSLRFSWPLLICVVLSTFQQNILKVYGYDLLDTDQFARLSVTLRLFMIIILLHGSIVAYYNKAIYSGDDNTKPLLIRYFSLILFGFIVIWLIWCYLHFYFSYTLLGLVPMILLSMYYLIFCIRSFLEMFIGRYNKIKLIAFYSTFSFIVFSLLFYFAGVRSISTIVTYQLLAETLNIIFVVVAIKRLTNEENRNCLQANTQSGY